MPVAWSTVGRAGGAGPGAASVRWTGGEQRRENAGTMTDLLADIEGFAQLLQNVTPSELGRLDAGPQQQVADIVDGEFMKVVSEFLELAEAMHKLPAHLLIPLRTAGHDLRSALKLLNKYTPALPQPFGVPVITREQTVTGVRGHLSSALAALTVCRFGIASSPWLEQAQTLVHDLAWKAGKFEPLVKEAERLIANLGDATASKVIQEQARHFAEARKADRSHGYIWLAVSLALAALLAVLPWYTSHLGIATFYSDLPWTTAGNLRYFGVRALTYSVISFLLVSAVRNYRASKHNELVNRHRANALGTYHTLKGSVSDDLLLQAAVGAIFSSQETGFGVHRPPATHINELSGKDSD